MPGHKHGGKDHHSRVVHDLHALARDVPTYVGRAFFEDGTLLSSDDIPTPTPTLIMEISARPDLIPFEFHEKVTFEVHLPDNYPAYPPEVTYRSATRASDPGRFDKPIIEKYMVKKEAEGGSSTELKVVIPLLRPKEETAWSRAYDLIVVFYALRELFAKPESWWLGPVVQGGTSKQTVNRRVYTMAGHHEAQGTRATMEDALSMVENTPPPPSPSFSIYSVFDGHGGHACSTYAAKALPGVLLHALGKLGPPQDVAPVPETAAASPMSPTNKAAEEYSKAMAAAMFHSLQEVDRSFLQEKMAEAEAKGEEEMNFSGTTAMVSLFDGRSRLLVASLGDCRAVLSRRGTAVVISAPEHKATRKDEAARIIKRGGFVSQGRVMGQLAVTRALGDAFYKGVLPNTVQSVSNEAEITEVTVLLPEDEFVVLACDGLWDVLTSQEVVDFVRTRLNNAAGGQMDQAFLCETCKALVDEAIGERKSKDNVSVILIRFSDVPPAGGVRPSRFSTVETTPPGGGGPVTSTSSFLLPHDKLKREEEPANCLIIGSSTSSLSAKESSDSLDEVDSLLQELDSLDDDFAAGSSGGSSPPRRPQAAAGGKKGEGSKAAALDPVLQGDQALMDYLMDDQNFTP